VRLNTLVIIVAAVVMGLVAALMARSLLSKPPEDGGRKIVVAARTLQFGESLDADKLQEMAWQSDQTPEGAFASIAEIIKPGQPLRFALAAIPRLTPIVAAQITAPGQKASMASMITEGKNAVTIRVDDVRGVAGFIMPGDRVDVALTRTDQDKRETSIDVILRGLKVLAIDQLTKERQESAQIAKSVTLEVDPVEAEKLILASGVGTLSLILRKAEDNSAHPVRRVTDDDLSGNGESEKQPKSVEGAPKVINSSDDRIPENKKTVTIRIIKKGAVQETSVWPE